MDTQGILLDPQCILHTESYFFLGRSFDIVSENPPYDAVDLAVTAANCFLCVVLGRSRTAEAIVTSFDPYQTTRPPPRAVIGARDIARLTSGQAVTKISHFEVKAPIPQDITIQFTFTASIAFGLVWFVLTKVLTLTF